MCPEAHAAAARGGHGSRSSRPPALPASRLPAPTRPAFPLQQPLPLQPPPRGAEPAAGHPRAAAAAGRHLGRSLFILYILAFPRLALCVPGRLRHFHPRLGARWAGPGLACVRSGALFSARLSVAWLGLRSALQPLHACPPVGATMPPVRAPPQLTASAPRALCHAAGHPLHEQARALLEANNPNEDKNSAKGLEGVQRRCGTRLGLSRAASDAAALEGGHTCGCTQLLRALTWRAGGRGTLSMLLAVP